MFILQDSLSSTEIYQFLDMNYFYFRILYDVVCIIYLLSNGLYQEFIRIMSGSSLDTCSFYPKSL